MNVRQCFGIILAGEVAALKAEEAILDDSQQGFVCDTVDPKADDQQAPAVILVDLDETIKKDDWATGILYCAMTRATVRLELVVKSECPWIETFRENLDG